MILHGEQDGSQLGVLIDFDNTGHITDPVRLATNVIKSKDGVVCVGTMPYMAIEVLRGYPLLPGGVSQHTMAHNSESILYILLNLFINTGGPQQRRAVPNKDDWVRINSTVPWFNTPSHLALAEIKDEQLKDFEQNLLAFVDPYFEDMKPMLRSLYHSCHVCGFNWTQSHWLLLLPDNLTESEVMDVMGPTEFFSSSATLEAYSENSE
ncbi:hypothetical protein PHLCEN_2v5210 [Hermanssonia centrifuga]|uniref:Fungal-type protein kinase domain-containing protein n=1 Tax=Hermanssonia centrifuga TaxID=98765 RepID=A0A2R6P995_9APHY|nr:hypothetical protein PHLCEN_2v5210 [Hermanssonia centrifuga]